MGIEIGWRFFVPVLFGLLALLFAVLGWRDRDNRQEVTSPARKARIRVAVIFALVSVILFVLQSQA